MYIFCVFSPGCISLHVALIFLSIWFRSLRFVASNELVFVYYYICIFLKDCFCFARANARLRLVFSASLPFLFELRLPI